MFFFSFHHLVYRQEDLENGITIVMVYQRCCWAAFSFLFFFLLVMKLEFHEGYEFILNLCVNTHQTPSFISLLIYGEIIMIRIRKIRIRKKKYKGYIFKEEKYINAVFPMRSFICGHTISTATYSFFFIIGAAHPPLALSLSSVSHTHRNYFSRLPSYINICPNIFSDRVTCQHIYHVTVPQRQVNKRHSCRINL